MAFHLVMGKRDLHYETFDLTGASLDKAARWDRCLFERGQSLIAQLARFDVESLSVSEHRANDVALFIATRGLNRHNRRY